MTYHEDRTESIPIVVINLITLNRMEYKIKLTVNISPFAMKIQRFLGN